MPNLPAKLAGGDAPIRVGLVGAGFFGSVPADQLELAPGMELVAVTDVRLEDARGAFAEAGNPDPISEVGTVEATDLAAERRVTYSLAYGDQSALMVRRYDRARTVGLDVVAAGRGSTSSLTTCSARPRTSLADRLRGAVRRGPRLQHQDVQLRPRRNQDRRRDVRAR